MARAHIPGATRTDLLYSRCRSLNFTRSQLSIRVHTGTCTRIAETSLTMMCREAILQATMSSGWGSEIIITYGCDLVTAY